MTDKEIMQDEKKTRVETLEKIKKILTSVIFPYREPILGSDFDHRIVNVALTDELAEFYAECLVYRGIGDVALLQQENEKSRKQNERH